MLVGKVEYFIKFWEEIVWLVCYKVYIYIKKKLLIKLSVVFFYYFLIEYDRNKIFDWFKFIYMIWLEIRLCMFG